MIGLLLLAGAGMAFAAARSAAARDRILNPRAPVAAPGPSVRLLCAVGRRPAALLEGRIAWLAEGWPPAAPGAVPAGVDPAALRAGGVIAFAGLAAAVPMLLGGGTGAVAALVVVAFGCAAPDLWLRATAARRAELIERRVPELVELVASMVAAGVGIDQSLRGAGEAVGGALGAEVEHVHANLALGRPRADELRDLALRTGSPSLAQLALTLRLSDRLGVPLAEALRRQADRARVQRARLVQERAAKAGPRVLVVVVFVLVPAALLPLAAAVTLTVSGSFTGL
ncbi:MAG TPA: type II secretion system F family protein [Gaiellales bacterium]